MFSDFKYKNIVKISDIDNLDIANLPLFYKNNFYTITKFNSYYDGTSLKLIDIMKEEYGIDFNFLNFKDFIDNIFNDVKFLFYNRYIPFEVVNNSKNITMIFYRHLAKNLQPFLEVLNKKGLKQELQNKWSGVIKDTLINYTFDLEENENLSDNSFNSLTKSASTPNISPTTDLLEKYQDLESSVSNNSSLATSGINDRNIRNEIDNSNFIFSLIKEYTDLDVDVSRAYDNLIKSFNDIFIEDLFIEDWMIENEV